MCPEKCTKPKHESRRFRTILQPTCELHYGDTLPAGRGAPVLRLPELVLDDGFGIALLDESSGPAATWRIEKTERSFCAAITSPVPETLPCRKLPSSHATFVNSPGSFSSISREEQSVPAHAADCGSARATPRPTIAAPRAIATHRVTLARGVGWCSFEIEFTSACSWLCRIPTQVRRTEPVSFPLWLVERDGVDVGTSVTLRVLTRFASAFGSRT